MTATDPLAGAPSARRSFEDLAPPVEVLQGRRAGIASRGTAFALDFLVILAGYPVLVWIYGAVVALFTFSTPTYPELPNGVEVALPAVWNWLYFTGSWALTGRTPGMTLLGLKVVARHRRRVGIVRANIRFFVLFSSTVFLIGPLWLACSRSRLAIHDRIARTQVIYDNSPRRREVAVKPSNPAPAPIPDD